MRTRSSCCEDIYVSCQWLLGCDSAAIYSGVIPASPLSEQRRTSEWRWDHGLTHEGCKLRNVRLFVTSNFHICSPHKECSSYIRWRQISFFPIQRDMLVSSAQNGRIFSWQRPLTRARTLLLEISQISKAFLIFVTLFPQANVRSSCKTRFSRHLTQFSSVICLPKNTAYSRLSLGKLFGSRRDRVY